MKQKREAYLQVRGKWYWILHTWDLEYGVKSMKKGRLLAKAFDAVTCKAGHACYLTSRELREDGKASKDDYIPLEDAKPIVLNAEIFNLTCPKCGEHIFEPTSDGNFGMTFYNRGKLVGDGEYRDEDEEANVGSE